LNDFPCGNPTSPKLDFVPGFLLQNTGKSPQNPWLKVISTSSTSEFRFKEIESLNEHIQEYDERVEKIAKEVYPEVALLKQVKGVGTQIALTYVLTIEDPYRFAKSRQVGCFLGLRPGRRNSGESEPQKGISKEGDRYLRTMMVQGAHYILGPFGEDSDLRRWGLKLAERGGKNAKKRAVVAVARKLAVLLHRLWVGGEVYEPLRNNQKVMREVA
jgi:transposase